MTESEFEVTWCHCLDAWSDTYPEAHDASEGEDGDGEGFFRVASSIRFGWYYVDRGFLTFDTSEVGHAVINTAILSLRNVGAYQADDGHSTLHVVQGVHEPDGLVAADFGELAAKITSGGEIAYDDWGGSWPDIELNSQGKVWINKTGYTTLGLRVAGDIDNLTPTGRNEFLISNAILTLTYTPTSGRHHPIHAIIPNIPWRGHSDN